MSIVPGHASPPRHSVVGSPRVYPAGPGAPAVCTVVAKQPTLAAAATAAAAVATAAAAGRPASPRPLRAAGREGSGPTTALGPVTSVMPSLRLQQGRPIVTITNTAAPVMATPRSRIVMSEPIAKSAGAEIDSLAQHMKALQQTKAALAQQQAYADHQLAMRKENLRRETLQALHCNQAALICNYTPRGLADALKMFPTPNVVDTTSFMCESSLLGHSLDLAPASLSSSLTTAHQTGVQTLGCISPVPTSAIGHAHLHQHEEALVPVAPVLAEQAVAQTPPVHAAVASAAKRAFETTQVAVANVDADQLCRLLDAVQQEALALEVAAPDAESGNATGQLWQEDDDIGASSHLLPATSAEQIAAEASPVVSLSANGSEPPPPAAASHGKAVTPPVARTRVPRAVAQGAPASPQVSSPPQRLSKRSPKAAAEPKPPAEPRPPAPASPPVRQSEGSGARSGSPPRRLDPDEVKAEQDRCRQTMATCVQALTPAALREIRNFAKLPPAVASVLEAACLQMDAQDFQLPAARRRLLGDGFCEKLLHFDFEGVTVAQYKKMRKLMSSVDDEVLRGLCPSAVPLAMWCRAIMGCLAKTRWPAGAEAAGPGQAPAAPAALAAGAAVPAALGSAPEAEPAAPPAALLTIFPDLATLSDAELSSVHELEVRRIGIGSIVFHGPTDCRNLDVESLVHLDVGEVLVYPQQGLKPSPGQGLNKCATVTMYQCWPPNGRGNLEDPGSRERYRSKIKAMTEEKRARFIDYDCSSGIWKFQVEHF